jgi:hypothetical protein
MRMMRITQTIEEGARKMQLTKNRMVSAKEKEEELAAARKKKQEEETVVRARPMHRMILMDLFADQRRVDCAEGQQQKK